MQSQGDLEVTEQQTCSGDTLMCVCPWRFVKTCIYVIYGHNAGLFVEQWLHNKMFSIISNCFWLRLDTEILDRTLLLTGCRVPTLGIGYWHLEEPSGCLHTIISPCGVTAAILNSKSGHFSRIININIYMYLAPQMWLHFDSRIPRHITVHDLKKIRNALAVVVTCIVNVT